MFGGLLLCATAAVAGVQLQAAPGEIADASSSASIVRSLISSMGGGVPGSPAAQAPVSGPVKAIQKDLVDAAIMFDEASNPYETAQEKSIKAALRSAALDSLSTSGMRGASTGASFLRTYSGKIGGDQLASIAAAAEEAAESHVASGRIQNTCGQCHPNFSVCPNGFQSTAVGTCTPSGGYAGYCNKDFAINDYSAVELEEAELFCGFCFPCA